MKASRTLVSAGLLGATGVALGAFGAHWLRPTLAALGTRDTWETAVYFQLFHAVALLAAAGLPQQLTENQRRHARRGAICWQWGVVLFSGSLYALAVGGPRWLGPVTPLGGAALIAGWVLLIVAALAKDQ
jgi:uncharacterized membrane protein YgdD (TMEM256/DUF423 family)